MNYEEFIYSLMDAEPTILAGAVVNNKGELVFQTENWELDGDLEQLNSIFAEVSKADGKSPGSLTIMKLKYMVVEFTPERVIATNVARKGHMIVAPVDKGGVAVFIDPKVGPRDALFNFQTFTGKLKGNL